MSLPLFDPAHLPYWLLLGIGVGLFLFVILSGGDDGDADAEVDADADGEFDLAQTLGWLGIGKAPLILLLATDLSLWGLLGWMGNVAGGAAWGIGILLGSMLLAFGLGGQIAKPVGKIFAAFGEDASSDRLIGCIGSVSTARIPIATEGKVGQVDVLDPADNLVTINAVLPDWATVMPERGTKVLVIDRTDSTYVVICRESADQDQWLSTHSS
jgi:hypothetical protein